jgi:hypothetical protein
MYQATTRPVQHNRQPVLNRPMQTEAVDRANQRSAEMQEWAPRALESRSLGTPAVLPVY